MAKRPRPNEAWRSSLKFWIVEWQTLDGEDCLQIRCPRCNGEALILHPHRWLGSARNRTFIGRVCTYCFKTNRVPAGEGDQ